MANKEKDWTWILGAAALGVLVGYSLKNGNFEELKNKTKNTIADFIDELAEVVEESNNTHNNA